ncbi:MRC1-like domain-containing protein [Pilobolus umbonatus]|nr:MRC1-like domain-containing protein [Pilobolus umbonatus]
MDIDTDEPLFSHRTPVNKDYDISDSDDDALSSSELGHDGLKDLNISSKLKEMLGLGFNKQDDTYDMDDESEDDLSFYKPPPFLKDNDTQMKDRETSGTNKFMNFPFIPAESTPKPKNKPRIPKEKKKRREQQQKKKKEVDIMEHDNTHLNSLFQKLKEGGESSDEEVNNQLYKKNVQKQKKGRRSRKDQGSLFSAVDENGEKLIRTTELLNTSSDESDQDHVLSKKDALDMYKETDRLRRIADVKIQPRIQKKSINDLITRIQQNRERRDQLLEKQKEPVSSPLPPPVTEYHSDEDDLEVIGGPITLSPSCPNPAFHLSPIRHISSVQRIHNQQLMSKMSRQLYEHKMKMEEEAKNRGIYRTALERAKTVLEREKDAEMFESEVKRRFGKDKNNLDEDEEDEEGDEDYDEDAEDVDIFAELSGQEEDDDEEEDIYSEQENEENEENEDAQAVDSADSDSDNGMAKGAFKRWKGKKSKSLFDDDENEDVPTKMKTLSKPVPSNSIANFFQKKAEEVEEGTENIERKPLSRLIKKEDVADDISANDGHEMMEVDEPIQPQRIKPSIPIHPKLKTRYFEEEAEVEEDEFFEAGGSDEEEGENLDEFEDDDLLVRENEETENIDEAMLRELRNKQEIESEKNMHDRIMKDIINGDYRKRKGAAEDGLLLQDYDLYDDDEDQDLIEIRRRAAIKRQKMLEGNGDILETLASNPKTAAFAKAARSFIEGTDVQGFSDSEDEVEEYVDDQTKSKKLFILDESDDEVEEMEERKPVEVTERFVTLDESDDEPEESGALSAEARPLEMKTADDRNILMDGFLDDDDDDFGIEYS